MRKSESERERERVREGKREREGDVLGEDRQKTIHVKVISFRLVTRVFCAVKEHRDEYLHINITRTYTEDHRIM